MVLTFKQLTQPHALEIADHWKYDGAYSFYDMTADPEDYREFVDEALRNHNDYYEVLDDGELIGFFCAVRENTAIEIGLGMRPDLCGRGGGKRFVTQIIAFIEGRYKFDQLVMYVASFNQRAIRAYRSCGFMDAETVMRRSNDGVYEFLKMVKKA